MPGTTPFRIPVSDLLNDPSLRRPVAIAAEIDWSVGEAAVGPGVAAELTLEGGAGGVFVRGTATADVTLTCHRCLVEWVEPLEITLTELMGVPEDPDGYPIHGGVADLEDMLRDALLLEVPLMPTCRADCRGICSVCGGDLNTGACTGHEAEIDSPFAVLRELLEPR